MRIYDRTLSAGEIAVSMGPLPVIKQGETYEPEEFNVVLTGVVDPKGLETAVHWEYGPTSSYGNKWPDTADEIEEFVSRPNGYDVPARTQSRRKPVTAKTTTH